MYSKQRRDRALTKELAVKDFFLDSLKSPNPPADEAFPSTHHRDLANVVTMSRYAAELMKLTKSQWRLTIMMWCTDSNR